MQIQPTALLHFLLDQFEQLMAQAEFGQSAKLPASSGCEQATAAKN